MKKEIIQTEKLSKPVGPYSLGVKVRGGNLLFTSGQAPWDSQGNVVGKGDIVAQTDQTLKNLQAVLEAGGATFDDVVKLTIYVTSFEGYQKITEIRKKYFKDKFPASTMVEVNRLVDKDMLIEIEAIAVVGD